MKDGVPDYTLNRNSTISPSSPAEYIPRGPRIEKQPVEVNSTVAKVFALGKNACTRSRAPRCAGTPQSGYLTVQDMGMNSSEKRSMAKGSVIPAI